MSEINYFHVLDQIKKNQFSPVMLLYGTESYFIQQIKKHLQRHVLNNEFENLSVYDLEETPIEEVITDVETYPFFGDYKLIFATNATFLQTRTKKLPFEHQLHTLEHYLDSPVDYSIFVLIAPYEKIDQRKRLTKSLKSKATTVHCESVKDQDLVKWVHQLGRQYKITFHQETLDLFQTELTADLQLLENEIKKFALYVGKDGVVTKDVAEKLMATTVEGSALSLVDAVMNRNYEKAFSIYRDLAMLDEEPVALIALLAFQFRMIFQVKILKEKGYNQNQIHRHLGGHPYVIKIALQRERRFTKKRLSDVIHELTKTDAAIKSGQTEKEFAFEMLLYHLIAH